MIENRIQIPPDPSGIDSTIGFTLDLAQRVGVHKEDQDRLKKVLLILLGCVIDNERDERFAEPIDIVCREDSSEFVIDIDNRGTPLFAHQTLSNTSDDSVPHMFFEARNIIETISFFNLGRRGQRFEIRTKIDPCSRQGISKTEAPSEPIEIRDLRDTEVSELSRLFYAVYGYQYVDDSVYFPKLIQERVRRGDLISKVAILPNGRMVGHIGLVKKGNSPLVYEPALGVVDPQIKSQGLFSKIFKEVMTLVKSIPMSYCFYDTVTNHDYSQRLISRYGSCEIALFVGSQVSETQAKLQRLGLGQDPQGMDRYSILLAVHPQTQSPFGKEVLLPTNVGDFAETILTPLGMKWIPSPRFYPLSRDGLYKTTLQETQKAVIFDLEIPGRAAALRILDEWRTLMHSGYEYAAVEVSLEHSGIGQLYDLLAKNGFFIAGLIPYHYSSQLGVRFQSLGPTRVAFDQIKVHSPTAKRLLEIVREDYERNRIL